MTTATNARRIVKKPAGKSFLNQRDTIWWRYIIGVIAIGFSLFPVLFVLSTAFNSLGILDGTHLIPKQLGLDNFRHLFVDFNDPIVIHRCLQHILRFGLGIEIRWFFLSLRRSCK